jgi:hypothetical protein
MYLEERGESFKEGADRVVFEVAWYVQDLLSAEKVGSLRAGLNEVVQKSCSAWQMIQRAEKRYKPCFDLIEFKDIGWETLKFDEFGTGSGEQEPEDGHDEALLAVFPRIYIVEGSELFPINRGVILRRSQSAAAAQESEWMDMDPSPLTPGAASPGRPIPRQYAMSTNTEARS